MSADQVPSATNRRLAPTGAALTIVLALTALPLLLWHRVLHDVLVSFHWSLSYAAGELAPWLLLAAGVACLVPVAASCGLHPESRLYPRGRRAYFIWGIVLYLLGIVLVVQMYDLWSYAH
jgi:hypothetical protein